VAGNGNHELVINAEGGRLDIVRDTLSGETTAPLDSILVSAQNGGPLQVELTDGRRGLVGRQSVSSESAEILARGALGKCRLTVAANGRERHLDFMLDAETAVNTGNPVFDRYYPVIKSFLGNDISEFEVRGRRVKGYRSPDTTPIWLRDHTHQSKGFKYFEREMTNALDYFYERQREDGSFLDFVSPEGDERRCDVEADVEYLMVDATHTAWQATGDDAWLASHLEQMERGLRYSLSDPGRWSDEYQLVKRPFTIDTWDFEYGEAVQRPDGSATHRSMFDDKTQWCIMHGDNSGVYHGCRLLARMYAHEHDEERAEYWVEQADSLRAAANRVCWNGQFYTHQVHITPVEVRGVDEREQLSLSHGYDINRGLPDHDQAVRILREYQRRREGKDTLFAEWFSVDPPFPSNAFGLDYLHPGTYVNGGLMPLVGGELARAAFEHGLEEYGLDILRRYYGLAIETGETYLWYFPDGSHWSGGSFLPTDGWGSAAMLYALMEGLAGIEDESTLYRHVRAALRWGCTGESAARVTARYGASDGYFAYRWRRVAAADEIAIDFTGSGEQARFHVLMPQGSEAKFVTSGGQPVPFEKITIEASAYAAFALPMAAGNAVIAYGNPEGRE